ncbi:MAG: transcriptional repressor [Chloroflexi bacterium]|nr:transcriptional repressor [Chloroflexota bacterium]
MMTTQTQERLLERLETAGHRLTGPRRAVLHLLAQRSEGFTAEELCQALGGVGRATVYRTIRLLLDLGVVCKLALQNGGTRYSLARMGHHHHAVCVRCGAVSDFRQCTVDDLLQWLRASTNGEVVGHRLEVYVLCQGCQEAQRSSLDRRAG